MSNESPLPHQESSISSKAEDFGTQHVMLRLNRLPTVEEATAATQRPLCESYWWFRGWNFNRPLIATIHVGVHYQTGPFVWMAVGPNCPQLGYRESDMQGLSFEMIGPIPLAEQFVS